MQVQAICNYKNQQCFGAVYEPKNVKWNDAQKPIVNSIKKIMREPLKKFNGESTEEFYKKKGLDFGIVPYTKESVFVNAYKDFREVGTGEDTTFVYSDYVNIGEYDKKFEFRPSDVESGLKAKRQDNIFVSTVFLIAGLGVLASIYLRHHIRESEYESKQAIELADTTLNKAKAFFIDTTAVNQGSNRKLLKAIKK